MARVRVKEQMIHYAIRMSVGRLGLTINSPLTL